MHIMIRPARPEDAGQITNMVNRFADQNIMLPRNEENVCQTINDWLVAVEVLRPQTECIDIYANSMKTPDFPRSSATTCSEANELLGRNHENNRAMTGEHVLGCGALVPLSDSLVEVRSVAIAESQHGKGLGSTLVLELVKMARERGYAQACAPTLRPTFFLRLGFEQVDRWSISPKVWQACIYCPKFHRCDEVAVLMNLEGMRNEREERNRQPGWNRLLKWGEWQPLRLAYRYEHQEVEEPESQP